MPRTLGRLGLIGNTVPPNGLRDQIPEQCPADAAGCFGRADHGDRLRREESIETAAAAAQQFVGGDRVRQVGWLMLSFAFNC